MDFKLKTGDKFSCIAFENLAIDDSLSKPLSLGDGLWTLPTHPFNLDKRWREWIGKIKADKVDRCNFFLLAAKESLRPDVLDAENKMLQGRLNRLLYGLLLQVIPDHVDGFVLNGAQISNETQIRQYSEMRNHYNSNPTKRVKVSESVCRQAKIFEEGYACIQDSSDYARVQRGMSAMARAISEQHFQERTHEYVRALEALTKPEIGKSTTQFTHRCQTFAISSSLTKDILEECYNIRSAVEHMNLVDTVFSGCSSKEIEARAAQRVRQIEKLATSVYLRLATSKVHAKIFETDTSIDEFWSRRDDERRAIWGTPVDISTIK
jgi:hypothetical protein